MTTTTRELVAGGVAAAGLLVLLFGLAMPWWLGTLLAAGLYAGLRISLPEATAATDIIHPGGVTEAERRDLIASVRGHLITIRTQIKRITEMNPDFAPCLNELYATADGLLTHFEREAKSVHLAGFFPLYLEKITTTLRRYIELAPQSVGDPVAQQSLARTEEMVESAVVTFQRLHQRLYKDDWIALAAEAETLQSLLESDLN